MGYYVSLNMRCAIFQNWLTDVIVVRSIKNLEESSNEWTTNW